MWETAGSVIGWIVGVGAVVSTGIAVMFLGTTRVQKETIEALKERAIAREQKLTDETAGRLKAEAEAEVLRGVVTGETHLVVIEGKTDQIATGLTEHHAEAMNGQRQIIGLLSRIAEQGDP